MSFEAPWAFLLLLLAPLFWDGLKGARKQKIKNLDSLPHAFPSAHGSLPTSIRARFGPWILSVLGTFTLVALVIALARPQTTSSFTEIEASGRDIMLVMDVSRSMFALDFIEDGKRINRLQALKKVVKTFIEKREGDRIGLVVFGDQAFTQCPLTLDHHVLLKFVEDLEIGMAGDGTAIGSAIGIGLKRLKQIEAESKVMVLVTDGKSNSGKISPIESARISKSLGVKIYTVGIGGDGPAPFPMRDIFGRTVYRERLMEFDEETLQEIATITSGAYYRADNLETLSKIYQKIDSIEERVEKENQWNFKEEHFLEPLLAGIITLFLYILLANSLLLKLP